MAADDPKVMKDELQFDRVAGSAAAPDATASSPAVTCVVCKAPVKTAYFHINGKTTCERCKTRVLAATSTPRGAAPMGKAFGLGLLAAIAGAAVYYAVIKITHFEIGIVAIAIGYMVGQAVRKGTQGKGGRRFQVLAVVLTYWAVGLAYTPLAFDGNAKHGKKSVASAATAAADSTGAAPAAASDTMQTSAPDAVTKKGPLTVLLSLGALFVFIFALPVIMIAGSMPGGLLSAIIIFIGMRQAWQLTAAPVYKVSGPYRVGAGPSAAPA